MDPRARAELSRRGYDGSGHRARQFQPSWFGRYDLVLAMDQGNLARLRLDGARTRRPPGGRVLFRSFDPALAGARRATTWRSRTPTTAGPRSTRWCSTWCSRPCGAWRTSSGRCWTAGRRPAVPEAMGAGLTDPDAAGLRLERLLGTGVRECRAVGGQHGVRHYRATLADGRVVFAKLAGAVGGAAPAGLRGRGARPALARRGGRGAGSRGRRLGRGGAGHLLGARRRRRTRQAAERFGRDLARMHAAGRRGVRRAVAGLDRRACRCGNDPGDSWPRVVRRRAAAALRPPGQGRGLADRGGRCGWSKPSPPASATWPGPPSRRAGSTATAGPGTSCGPAAGDG